MFKFQQNSVAFNTSKWQVRDKSQVLSLFWAWDFSLSQSISRQEHCRMSWKLSVGSQHLLLLFTIFNISLEYLEVPVLELLIF